MRKIRKIFSGNKFFQNNGFWRGLNMNIKLYLLSWNPETWFIITSRIEMLIHSLFRLNQNTITTINKAHNSNISVGLRSAVHKTSLFFCSTQQWPRHICCIEPGLSADISCKIIAMWRLIINIINTVSCPLASPHSNEPTFNKSGRLLHWVFTVQCPLSSDQTSECFRGNSH